MCTQNDYRIALQIKARFYERNSISLEIIRLNNQKGIRKLIIFLNSLTVSKDCYYGIQSF